MANQTEPLVKLEPSGTASILSYNVPDPTSYSGRHFIDLVVAADAFNDHSRMTPQTAALPVGDPVRLRDEVEIAMRSGFSDARLFARTVAAVGLRSVAATTADTTAIAPVVVSAAPITDRLANLKPEEVTSMVQAGLKLNIYQSMYGTLTYDYSPHHTVAEPRIYLIETYRLSSFLGKYGAGRTLKTFSLLPGEKTSISIKSYVKTEREQKSASSILDSFTQESSDNFEHQLQEEASDKAGYQHAKEYQASASASASWGFGSAKASASTKSGTTSAREEFAKNLSNALEKHAAQASAKRDVQINTSFDVHSDTGEETSIQREISNINLSRTLNFVFRQMNQEFISLLHLVDVRVGFSNNFPEAQIEVSLPELDRLFDAVIVDDAAKRAALRATIVAQLDTVFDHQDVGHSIIEQRMLDASDGYLRVRRNLTATYEDPQTGTSFVVPGIIVAASSSVLRTDGVVVEALLGQGMALDPYATQLQDLEVRRRSADVTRAELLNEAVRGGDELRSQLLTQLTCPCGAPSPEQPSATRPT